MPEQGFTDGERSESRGDGRKVEVPSPDAEEIARVVDVAEALGISPDVAAAALRDDDGDVPTDVRLGRSIEDVEDRLEQYA